MDNTRVENAIQPFVVGRKNWVFSNTQLGQVLCGSARLLSLPVQWSQCGELFLQAVDFRRFHY